MRIGLTGGIASGKSTVARLLVELGAYLVDADEVAREVVLPGEPALAAVASRFGQAVLREDGSLDRKKLGGIVFQDRAALQELEAILHPAIRQEMQKRMRAEDEQHPNGLVVADVPLLYETKQEKLYEGILVSYVPAYMQAERLMQREAMGHEEAERRVALQMDIEEKRKHADWVIDNSGSLEETRSQVLAFWKSQGLP
ncbi:dephospho-CoA kinase [Paenibacillus sp. HB172176]|uniref:dephospho-CoA kinase n=1 Tax=Paenibacillus sp. HB172176 TaxID=2493690 RepID=UPI00143CAB5B|nr:dephospho-CoA kinase [Paenibacillus sp. HB172176]